MNWFNKLFPVKIKLGPYVERRYWSTTDLAAELEIETPRMMNWVRQIPALKPPKRGGIYMFNRKYRDKMYKAYRLIVEEGRPISKVKKLIK